MAFCPSGMNEAGRTDHTSYLNGRLHLNWPGLTRSNNSLFPPGLPLNWLRVLRSAEAARIGPGVGQQRHTRAVRSEKCVRLRGRAWVGMRVIAVFFGPYAPDVLTAYGSVFSHDFKRLDRFTKLATSSVQYPTS